MMAAEGEPVMSIAWFTPKGGREQIDGAAPIVKVNETSFRLISNLCA